MDHSAEIIEVTARLDDFARRDDRRTSGGAAAAPPRRRGKVALVRRLTNVGMALGALIVATIVFGWVIAPIGIGGLFLVMTLMLLAILLFSVWPGERPIPEFRDDMPNEAVVRRLGRMLDRAALPGPAAARAYEIRGRLHLLESRLGETAPLDPLAQDARRLLGRHLPDLLQRYERVPVEFRHERDGEGLTVDQRLVQGLDAASAAIDDLSRKLAHEDLTAFETQGRFIESRYKEDPDLRGR